MAKKKTHHKKVAHHATHHKHVLHRHVDHTISYLVIGVVVVLFLLWVL